MPDPLEPQDSSNEKIKSGNEIEPPRPSEGEGVQALAEIDESTKKVQRDALPVPLPERRSWFSRNTEVILYLGLVLTVCGLAGWGLSHATTKLFAAVRPRSGTKVRAKVRPQIDPAMQAEAEALLQRLAAGDTASVDQILSQSDSWTGNTARTQKIDQLLGVAINLKDMQVRSAAIQAMLAVEGVPRNSTGLKLLEDAVGNPGQRAWALWLLGALGSRGVDPVHVAKIIGAYLDDPVVDNRAAAVNGLALLATDETVPMLLDRFRNDPSPVVQERAVCGLSEAGMYTHEQRMVAAASMVGWLDDSLMSAQQRIWMFQALQDISGMSFGTDSAAWRRWYEGNRRGSA